MQLTHTLHPRSFCSLEHFTLKWLGTVCFPTHFAPQHTLLPDTLYSSAHFTSQHTLLPRILFSSAHFTSWNTLLPRTLCFLCSKDCREHFTKEQNVPGSKVFQGAECSRKQNVLGSKVLQEAKRPGIKMFLGAKYETAKCVKKQSVMGSKVCLSRAKAQARKPW